MIRKEDVMCVEKVGSGPFWEEFLVFIEVFGKQRGFFGLRIMKKKKIVEYGEEEMVWLEYSIRSGIRHKFISNTVCGFQDYDHLFLLEELSRNSLMELVTSEKQLSIKATRFYVAEILMAIQHLHSKGLSYRFLSPKTMMIGDDGHIKLRYDFLNGIDTVLEDMAENIEYASIDDINDEDRAFISDYWSVGIILYYILSGTTPFSAQTTNERVERMKQCKPVFSGLFDENTKDLISKLLVISVEDRLGYKDGDADVIRKHPFFEKIDWELLLKKKVEPPFLFNAERRKSSIKAANLNVLYTTDIIPGIGDGYGNIFEGYGTGPVHSSNVYKQLWRFGVI